MSLKAGAERSSRSQAVQRCGILRLRYALGFTDCLQAGANQPRGLGPEERALEFYRKDSELRPSPLEILVPKLPEILELSDLIQHETPAAAKRVGFEFGRMKTGKHRAGARTNKNSNLPIANVTMNYRAPNGWPYPMLAALGGRCVYRRSELFIAPDACGRYRRRY